MKICHVITRMIVGGAQENTLFSIRGALEKGHSVTLITGPSEGPEGELLKRIRCPGMRLLECPFLVRELSFRNDPRAFFFLKKYFRTERFDVVHTHSSKAGIIGRLAAHAAGVPLVVHTVHGLAFNRYEKPWRNFLYIASERLAARVSDRIFTVAQAMIDQSLAAGVGKPEQYRVVYSGMELERFLESRPDPELRQKLGIPEDARVFATLARLFPMKGYEDFIPLALKIASDMPSVFFLIIGDGILMEKLKKQISEAGFSPRFRFTGLIPPDEVHRYLALCDVLVHFSLREGLPRAAVQALACGKPVVAYNLDGTPEVVLDGKTGRIVEPEDPVSAERAMRELIADPELASRYGEAGRELIKDRFGWRKMSDTLLAEYADLAARKLSGGRSA